VVSVGNLTVGGSGKTPLVGEIARLLLAMGERPSILSRGYGRMKPVDGVVVVSDGRQIKTDIAHAGDEPYMLARSVPGAVVVVNSSRYLAGRVAELQLGCTVHLLDDGFQHLQLMRDIDLLVAPPADFVNTRTLPFGRFREPLDSARAADALLVPLNDASDTTSHEKMSVRLKVPTAFGFTRTVLAPTSMAPVFAFAGIAKPDDFFMELQRAGWRLAGHRAFPDHHIYTMQDLDALEHSARASGAEILVTTSKDAVKVTVESGPPRPGEAEAPGSSEVEASRTTSLFEVPLQISIEPAFRPWLHERLTKAREA
jgi:tetraacyldisaccharide 4'-kinase